MEVKSQHVSMGISECRVLRAGPIVLSARKKKNNNETAQITRYISNALLSIAKAR